MLSTGVIVCLVEVSRFRIPIRCLFDKSILIQRRYSTRGLQLISYHLLVYIHFVMFRNQPLKLFCLLLLFACFNELYLSLLFFITFFVLVYYSNIVIIIIIIFLYDIVLLFLPILRMTKKNKRNTEEN